MRTSMLTFRAGHRAAVAATVGVALVALAGCSGSAGAGEESGAASTAGDEPSATETSGPADPASLTGDIVWWGWTPDKTNGDKLIAEFNKEYPNIKVEYVAKPIDSYDQVMGPAVTSADGPDVFGVSTGANSGNTKIFEPAAIDLTPAIEKSLGADWKDKLAPTGIRGLSVGDKLVGLSVGSVYAGNLWVNQDIFDEYGLTPPTTLDEWKDVCTQIRSHGIECFVQGAAQNGFNVDTFHAIVDNIEPGLFNQATGGDVKWTDPRIVQALGTWQSLFTDGIMQEGATGVMQYPDANNVFMSGKAAMIMMGTWYTQYAVKASMVAAMEAAGVASPTPFPIIPVDFPDLAGDGNTGQMFGDADYGLAVSAKSDQQEAATAFALWLTTSAAGQQSLANTLNDIPALIGVTPEWDGIELVNPEVQKSALQKYTEHAATATSSRFAEVVPDLNTGIKEGLTGVATGSMTPEQGAAAMQAGMDKAAAAG